MASEMTLRPEDQAIVDHACFLESAGKEYVDIDSWKMLKRALHAAAECEKQWIDKCKRLVMTLRPEDQAIVDRVRDSPQTGTTGVSDFEEMVAALHAAAEREAQWIAKCERLIMTLRPEDQAIVDRLASLPPWELACAKWAKDIIAALRAAAEREERLYVYLQKREARLATTEAELAASKEREETLDYQRVELQKIIEEQGNKLAALRIKMKEPTEEMEATGLSAWLQCKGTAFDCIRAALIAGNAKAET